MSVDLNKLDGRIITFESVRFPGWFIDSRDKSSDEACITMLPPSKRVDPNKPDSNAAEEWPQWIVRVRERDGVVSFESRARPNFYLDLSHWKGHGHFNKVLVTWVSQLDSVGKWGQFRIMGNMNGATIQSRRWTDRWLCAQKRKKVMGGQGPDRFGEWGHWIIKDVFAGADKKKANEVSKLIVGAEWVDSLFDMTEGMALAVTIGKSITTGDANTIGDSTSSGKSVTFGVSAGYVFELGDMGVMAHADYEFDKETTEHSSQTKSFSCTKMEERTERLAPPAGSGMKKYTAFYLRVDFNDGDKMILMGQMIPTDRLEGTFNESKVPEVPPPSALLATIKALESF